MVGCCTDKKKGKGDIPSFLLVGLLQLADLKINVRVLAVGRTEDVSAEGAGALLPNQPLERTPPRRSSARSALPASKLGRRRATPRELQTQPATDIDCWEVSRGLAAISTRTRGWTAAWS